VQGGVAAEEPELPPEHADLLLLARDSTLM
jgi:hypothetical protein